MGKIIFVILTLAVTVCFFGVNPATAVNAGWSPLPKDLNVVTPGPEVPPKVAAPSGQWVGSFTNRRGFYLRNVQVVFEKVDSTQCTVVYSVSSTLEEPGGYWRWQGTIDEEGRCVFKSPSGKGRVEMILVGTELHLRWIGSEGQFDSILSR